MLSAFSRNINHFKKFQIPFYELGRVFSDHEITTMKNKVEVSKNNKDKYKLIMDSFNITNPANDLPKLNLLDRKKYIDASRIWAEARHEYTELYPKLVQMMQSQGLPKAQPTFKDFLDYAKSKKSYPSKIADEFASRYSSSEGKKIFYPDFVLMIADNERVKLMKNYPASKYAQAKIIPYWVDRVIHDLDLQNKNKKLRQLVDMRIKALNDKVKLIKENELDLMKDVVKEHLGVGTSKFSSSFIRSALKFTRKDKSNTQILKETKLSKAISSSVSDTTKQTSIKPSLNTMISITPISITTKSTSTTIRSGGSLLSGSLWNDYHDEGLGWNPFKDISNAFNSVANVVKRAGENVQRELENAIKKVSRNTIGSQLSKDLLPKELYAAANKLTATSIEIMVGKISPERIGNALEALYMISAHASQSVTWVVDETTGAILASPLGRQIDGYTGGMISSVKRIAEIDNNIIDDVKVNPMMLAMDMVKVGLAVYGAGSVTGVFTKVGENAATNYVGQQAGLNKTVLGRSVLSVAVGGAKGGSVQSLLRKEVKTVAKQEATKQTVKTLTPIIGKDASNIIGVAAVSATTKSYNDPKSSFSEIMKSTAVTTAKTQAKQIADKEIRKSTGGLIGLNELEKLYSLDPANITKENASKVIDLELLKIKKRINDERIKALNVKDQIKYEYELARAKLSDPNLVDKLQAETKKRIDAETKKISDKIDNAEKEINKALDSVKNFDLEKEIANQKKILADNLQREKEAFQALTMKDVFNQAKQYGPDLLRYLMSKYGPQPNYDKFVTEYDLGAYKAWTPTANIYPPKNKFPTGLLMGGISIVGAYMVMKE